MRTRPLALAVALGVAGTLCATPALSAAPASAAPGQAAHAAHAKAAKSPKATPAKVRALRTISLRKGQYAAWRNRVRGCAAASADLRAANRMRARALRKVSVWMPVRTLRTRQVILSRAVKRLVVASRKCGVVQGETAVAPGAPAPQPIVVNVPPPGGGQGGGVTVDAPPITIQSPIDLRSLLSGVPLDLSQVLGGLALPPDLSIVDLGSLGLPVCVGPDAGCVAIDVDALRQAVQDLVAANLLPGLLNELTNLRLTGLLGQVEALLGTGDLASLVDVERVSDTVVRLVPKGPLAELSAEVNVPDVVVGQVHLSLLP
jgi:hypothetical protein